MHLTISQADAYRFAVASDASKTVTVTPSSAATGTTVNIVSLHVFRGPDMAVAFPNADLTVYLGRPVEGEWVRLEATSTWGDDGIGLTHSTLADLAGPVGVAQQSLVLSPAAG